MKRFLSMSLCFLSLTLLLTACGAGGTLPDDEEFQDAWDEAWNDFGDIWSDLDDQGGEAAHYYQVLNGQEEELYTITDETQVTALDDLLGNVGKEQQETPVWEEDGEIACIYVYQQEKTLLAGEDPEEEREYREVIRFTVYQDQNFITLQCLKGLEDRNLAGVHLEDFLTFTISVSPEVMETLRDPAQFAG